MANGTSELEGAIGGVVRLIRESRLEQAAGELAGIIRHAPEGVAHWLLLARLMNADPDRWEREIQASLGRLGTAPLLAFQRTVRILDQAVAGEDPRIALLETWLTGLCVPHPGDAASEESAAALEKWLDQARSDRAQRGLDAPARLVARLEELKSACSPRRTMSRLERLRETLT